MDSAMSRRSLAEKVRRELRRFLRRFRVRWETPIRAVLEPLLPSEEAAFGPRETWLEQVQTRFRVPRGAQPPRVSIVITIGKDLDSLLRCLLSIDLHAGALPFEVLLVEEGPEAAAAAVLNHLGGVQYLPQQLALGPAEARNRGARQASGDWICFLSREAVVREGWLEALADSYSRDPLCGVAGPCLFHPDGRLLAAGGHTTQEGAWLARGWDDVPFPTDETALQMVEGCSGAALLIDRNRFLEMGGFDSRRFPASHWDLDLAFRLRARGFKVICQPLSRVVMGEGFPPEGFLDSGDPGDRRRFRETWSSWLGPELLDGRWATKHAPRVLVVDQLTPTPDRDSGSIDMVNTLRILVEFGCQVTFLAVHPVEAQAHYTRPLQAMGITCIQPSHMVSVAKFLRERGREFELVVLTRLEVAGPLLKRVRRHCPAAKVVFNTVDLHHVREARRARLEGSVDIERRAKRLRRKELGLVSAADATLVISPEERALLGDVLPSAKVVVVPLLRESASAAPTSPEGRSDLIFIGGFKHSPNVDAVLNFAREAWPLIHEALPSMQWHVVGSHPPEEILQLQGAGILVHGFVEDLAPVLQRCRASLAPLRYGAGLKGKVVTSLEHGVPCVATPLALEGMGLVPGEEVLVADTPETFRDRILDLSRDDETWAHLSRSGARKVAEAFSLDVGRQRWGELFRDLRLPPFGEACSFCGCRDQVISPLPGGTGMSSRCSECGAPQHEQGMLRRWRVKPGTGPVAVVGGDGPWDKVGMSTILSTSLSGMPGGEEGVSGMLAFLAEIPTPMDLARVADAIAPGGRLLVRLPAETTSSEGHGGGLYRQFQEAGFDAWCLPIQGGGGGSSAFRVWEAWRIGP